MLYLQASQSDELSITEGEELQVIEDGDMEDWLKVTALHMLDTGSTQY